MDRQLSRLDFLFVIRISNEPFGQFRTFTVGHHPAHHITAEDVEDHVEIKIGPLRRAEQFRDIPAPELVGTGGQQFGLGVSRMHELVAALTRLSLVFENPVHGANRAMITAFVEQRGVNRSRRAVLKSLLMKAGQDHFPFRANQRTLHVSLGRAECRFSPKLAKGVPTTMEEVISMSRKSAFIKGSFKKLVTVAGLVS